MRSLRQRRAKRELEDHRRKAQGLLADAEYARQRGDLEEALRLYDEAERLDPGTPAGPSRPPGAGTSRAETSRRSPQLPGRRS